MPGLDRTGPWGEGPMTGGARGYCNPGYTGHYVPYGRGYGQGRGRGFRRGFGPGIGWGRGYGRRRAYPARWDWHGRDYGPAYAGADTMSREDEISMLKEQADMLEADLNAITKRMEALESETPAS